MNTVVLPLCEKCGKPILDGTGVSVDGYIHVLDNTFRLGTRLVGGPVGPYTYHTVCLNNILQEIVSRRALQELHDTADKMRKAADKFFMPANAVADIEKSSDTSATKHNPYTYWRTPES